MSVCTVMNRNINIFLKIFSPSLRIFISTCKKVKKLRVISSMLNSSDTHEKR